MLFYIKAFSLTIAVVAAIAHSAAAGAAVAAFVLLLLYVPPQRKTEGKRNDVERTKYIARRNNEPRDPHEN